MARPPAACPAGCPWGGGQARATQGAEREGQGQAGSWGQCPGCPGGCPALPPARVCSAESPQHSQEGRDSWEGREARHVLRGGCQHPIPVLLLPSPPPALGRGLGTMPGSGQHPVARSQGEVPGLWAPALGVQELGPALPSQAPGATGPAALPQAHAVPVPAESLQVPGRTRQTCPALPRPLCTRGPVLMDSGLPKEQGRSPAGRAPAVPGGCGRRASGLPAPLRLAPLLMRTPPLTARAAEGEMGPSQSRVLPEWLRLPSRHPKLGLCFPVPRESVGSD